MTEGRKLSHLTVYSLALLFWVSLALVTQSKRLIPEWVVSAVPTKLAQHVTPSRPLASSRKKNFNQFKRLYCRTPLVDTFRRERERSGFIMSKAYTRLIKKSYRFQLSLQYASLGSGEFHYKLCINTLNRTPTCHLATSRRMQTEFQSSACTNRCNFVTMAKSHWRRSAI